MAEQNNSYEDIRKKRLSENAEQLRSLGINLPFQPTQSAVDNISLNKKNSAKKNANGTEISGRVFSNRRTNPRRTSKQNVCVIENSEEESTTSVSDSDFDEVDWEEESDGNSIDELSVTTNASAKLEVDFLKKHGFTFPGLGATDLQEGELENIIKARSKKRKRKDIRKFSRRKMDTIRSLIARCTEINDFAASDGLQSIARSAVPESFVVKSFSSAQSLLNWFDLSFSTIIDDHRHCPFVAQPCTLSILVDAITERKGSEMILATILCSIIRSFEVPCRLVFSLFVESGESEKAETLLQDKRTCWVEVFVDNRWSFLVKNNPVPVGDIIIAFSEFGFPVEVTESHTSGTLLGKVRRLPSMEINVDDSGTDWISGDYLPQLRQVALEKLLLCTGISETYRNLCLQSVSEQQLENDRTSLQGKDTHLQQSGVRLQRRKVRQLNKLKYNEHVDEEVIKSEVEMIKDNPSRFKSEIVAGFSESEVLIYESAIQKLYSRNQLRKLGLQVTKKCADQALKKRVVRRFKRSKDKLEVNLYSIKQTEPLPQILTVNGVIVKNKFGNVEVFNSSMVPPELVHVSRQLFSDHADFPDGLPFNILEKLSSICLNLGIECAPALIGFSSDTSSRSFTYNETNIKKYTPKFDGVVIFRNDLAVVRDACLELKLHYEKEAKLKHQLAIAIKWAHFARFLLTKASVLEKNQSQDQDSLSQEADPSSVISSAESCNHDFKSSTMQAKEGWTLQICKNCGIKRQFEEL